MMSAKRKANDNSPMVTAAAAPPPAPAAALHEEKQRRNKIEFSLLPKEALERCLSFLDAKELCLNVERVCKSFRDISVTSRFVWEGIALRKYGAEILAAAAVSDTNGGGGNYASASYKRMVADDMRLVATPVLSKELNPIRCKWKYNRPASFYICLLYCFQYHRPTNEIRIYFEARGESDLRHPDTCSVARWRTHYERPKIKTKGFQGISYGRGHYKGYVAFDASFFETAGLYTFLYADPTMTRNLNFPPDYTEVTIPGLENVFAPPTKNAAVNYLFKYTVHDWSYFDNDGDDDHSIEATELERFRHAVEYPVWNRHNSDFPQRKWWVGRNGSNGNAASDNSSSLTRDSDVYSSFMDSLALAEERARRARMAATRLRLVNTNEWVYH